MQAHSLYMLSSSKLGSCGSDDWLSKSLRCFGAYWAPSFCSLLFVAHGSLPYLAAFDSLKARNQKQGVRAQAGLSLQRLCLGDANDGGPTSGHDVPRQTPNSIRSPLHLAHLESSRKNWVLLPLARARGSGVGVSGFRLWDVALCAR